MPHKELVVNTLAALWEFCKSVSRMGCPHISESGVARLLSGAAKVGTSLSNSQPQRPTRENADCCARLL